MLIYHFLAALRLQSMPPPSSYTGCWRFDARLVYHPIYSINPTYTTYFIYFIFVCWQYDKLSPHMCNEHINHQTNYLGNMQNTHVESTANGKTSSPIFSDFILRGKENLPIFLLQVWPTLLLSYAGLSLSSSLAS